MTSRLKRRSSLQLHNRSGGGNGALLAHAAAASDLSANESFDDSMVDSRDSEAEERERKARRGLHKRQSLGGATGHASVVAAENGGGTPASAGASAAAPANTAVYSAAQLTEIYDNCIRLSAENKINIKNAFQLKMIDYMAEMMKKKRSELDNFQAASCALDASTKIYAYRVDSVHTDTLKLASGVGSSKAEKGEAQQDDGEDGGGADGEDGKKKRKKRKRATMVEKNLNNINCSKFELEFDVDPLFKKVSAQFDSGGGGGQFLSTLRMRDDSCELLLDSNSHVSLAAAAPSDAQTSEKCQVELAYLPRLLDGHRICPTFADFSFRNWSLEKEDEMQQEEEAQSGAANPLMLDHNEEHAYDPDAVPAADDGDDAGGDGGMFGGVDFDADGDEDEEGRPAAAFQKNSVTMALMDVKTLRDHLSSVPTEYSYFDTGRIGAWAGPKHWKFKPFNRLAPPEEDRKKRAKKDKEKMDFEELDGGGGGLGDFVEKAITVPQRSKKLQNRTIESWSDEKNVLPEDMHYSGGDFVRLEFMTRSNVAPRCGRGASQSVDDTIDDDYNFDNPNDTNDFCPPASRADDVVSPDTAGGGSTMQDFTTMGSQSAEGFTNLTSGDDADKLGLIAAPNRVEKVQIGYAKQAKKVDMRRLKTVEWSILNESARIAEDKENSVDSANKTAERSLETTDPDATVLERKGVKFREMYSTLLTPGQLPSKMKDSLSVPLAFVALLHLCNEQVLELKCDEKNFTDLTIRKA